MKQSVPSGEIEKASIDEAFLDLSKPVRERLLERHPYLAKVPDDAPEGADSPLPPPPPIDWSQLGELVTLTAQGEESEPQDETSNYENDHLTSWHDVALSIGAELIAKLREEIFRQLGYTMSAGIARNKFLAKLCASYKKPNSQSILRNDAIPSYLRPMPFQKVRDARLVLGVNAIWASRYGFWEESLEMLSPKNMMFQRSVIYCEYISEKTGVPLNKTAIPSRAVSLGM